VGAAVGELGEGVERERERYERERDERSERPRERYFVRESE
jgi:hypothetical protein